MSSAPGLVSAGSVERRRRIRRTATVFGLIAAAFYLGFIIISVLRSMP